MLNMIIGIFVGFNLVFIECLIVYGFYKKRMVKKATRFSNK